MRHYTRLDKPRVHYLQGYYFAQLAILALIYHSRPALESISENLLAVGKEGAFGKTLGFCLRFFNSVLYVE